MVNINWKTAIVAVLGVIIAYEILKRDAISAASTIGSAVNPVNHDNIFAKGADATVQAVTGGKYYTVDVLTPVFDFFSGKK